jgi:thiol-disulfide isomerase/thioredoxin
VTPSRREALVLGAAGIAAAAAGFLAGPMLLRLGGSNEEAALRAASFPDLNGWHHALTEWDGKVVLWNFWATWCAPCREEIPLLLDARQKYAPKGLEIVGIAIDNAAKVRDFTATFAISYQILQAEADGMELMRQLGNVSGGLPYTVVTDRKGRLSYRKLGALRQPDLDDTLGPLVQT